MIYFLLIRLLFDGILKFSKDQESILPNHDFFVFLIFAIKLGHFKIQAIFSHATNTQA